MLSIIVFCSLYRLLVARILKLAFFFQLVLEHKEAIAPDHSDLLHELLKDLGEVPDVESLLGKIITNTNTFTGSSFQTPAVYTPRSKDCNSVAFCKNVQMNMPSLTADYKG